MDAIVRKVRNCNLSLPEPFLEDFLRAYKTGTTVYNNAILYHNVNWSLVCVSCNFHVCSVIISTEVFGSTGFGNNGFSGVTDIFAIPKLKFYIKNVQSIGFPRITDKMASPNWSVTSENLCTLKCQSKIVGQKSFARKSLRKNSH